METIYGEVLNNYHKSAAWSCIKAYPYKAYVLFCFLPALKIVMNLLKKRMLLYALSVYMLILDIW